MCDSDPPTSPPKDSENVQRIPVYVSYNWEVEAATQIVDKLEQLFKAHETLRLIRDKRYLKYRDSIIDFMDRLGSARHVVAVVGREFLESAYCMYEMLKVSQEGELKERLYPLLVKGLSLSTANHRADWGDYWEDKADAFDRRLKTRRGDHRPGQHRDLDRMTEIRNSISELLDYIASHNNLVVESGADSDLSQLLERIEKDAAPSPASNRQTTPKRPNGRVAAQTPVLGPLILGKIRDLFNEHDSRDLRPLLAAEAAKVIPVADDKDCADLLCSSEAEVDQAIAWLILAARDYLKKLRRQGGDVQAFKNKAREVLGWLVLRAVDPQWLAAHGSALRSPRARVEVSIRRSSCIEVAVSGAEARGARFHVPGVGVLAQGETVIHAGGEPGIDPPSTRAEVLGAIWRQVVGRPLPKHFGRDEMKELREALETDSLIERHYHLCADLSDPKTPVTGDDLDELQLELKELKLILIRSDGGAALLVDEMRLDRSILNFFRYVVEEKS